MRFSLIGSRDPEAIRAVAGLSEREKIPSEYDKLLLTMGGARTGSPLGMNRRYYIRRRFKAASQDALAESESDA